MLRFKPTNCSTRSSLFVSASVDFSRSLQRGAALYVHHEAERQNAVRDNWFRSYLRKHYRSWYNFLIDQGIGIAAHDIIFVTGHDLTGEWATAVMYERGSQSGAQIGTGFNPAAPVCASASVDVADSTFVSVPVRRGPSRSRHSQPSHTGTIPAPGNTETEVDLQARNQCIFVRGYRIIQKALWFTIKAAAGYDNLDNNSDSDSSTCVVPAEASFDEGSGSYCEDEVRENILVSSSETEANSLRC